MLQPTEPASAQRHLERERRAGRPLAQLQLRGTHARDKTSLDIFWLKDKGLTHLDNLPEPDELAEEIIENLEAGLNPAFPV